MISKIKHYLKEIIYFVVVMTIFSNVISLYKSQNLNESPLQISSFKLLNNKMYTLHDNKPVLIHFWATWCPTCKLEASNIEFLSKHFEVITIAVNSKDDKTIQAYLNANDYSFRVVNDSNSLLSTEFKIAAFPTTFIYDKEKNLVFSDVGYSSTFTLYLKMLWAGMH